MLQIGFARNIEVITGETAHLLRVEIAEVDRLGDVGIALDPILAGLENFKRGQFEPITAQEFDAGSVSVTNTNRGTSVPQREVML